MTALPYDIVVDIASLGGEVDAEADDLLAGGLEG